MLLGGGALNFDVKDDSGAGNLLDDVRSSLGLVHVYTGNGKGKTTAALGLSLRALEHGLSVAFIQFLKGGSYIGELLASHRYDGRLVFEQFGKGSDDQPQFEDFSPDEQDRLRALNGLRRAKELLKDFDVVVLDEVNVAVSLGHLREEEVLDLVKNKPENTELVLTGRNAPKSFFDVAHYVTEMRCHKHPFDQGILGRRGVDY